MHKKTTTLARESYEIQRSNRLNIGSMVEKAEAGANHDTTFSAALSRISRTCSHNQHWNSRGQVSEPIPSRNAPAWVPRPS